jgi:tetratricopeptide (TPR) repeat protein
VWTTAAIRDLLVAAFSDEELVTLCFEHFRSVYDSFAGGMGREQKILRLMEYCDRHKELGKLLKEIKERNPNQYLAALYQRGIGSYKEHKLPEARRALQAVVDIDPEHKDAARVLETVKQHLKPAYLMGVSAQEKGKLPEARRALPKVVDIDAEYKNSAQLLAQVKEIEQRRRTHYLKTGAIFAAVVLVVIALWLWPRAASLLVPRPMPAPGASLDAAQVSFTITRSDGETLSVPIESTLALMPGEGILIGANVVVDQVSFPHDLSFQYFAPGGSVPAKIVGPRTSYIAPKQPGPDVIATLITDQVTHDTILRSVRVIVKAKE